MLVIVIASWVVNIVRTCVTVAGVVEATGSHFQLGTMMNIALSTSQADGNIAQKGGTSGKLEGDTMTFEELLNELRQSSDPIAQDVVRHIDSPQFQLSLKILGKRIERGLSKAQAARLTGMSVKEYEAYENGTLKATKEQYKRVLEKME